MTAPTSPDSPIDPTTTDAWAELEAHDLELEGSLREWFAADPQRAERFTYGAADLHVDLSKNLVSPRTVELLLQLAREVGVTERRDAMFAGAHINTTEDRAVLHTALRRPAGSSPPSRSTARTSTRMCAAPCIASTTSRTRCAPVSGPA